LKSRDVDKPKNWARALSLVTPALLLVFAWTGCGGEGSDNIQDDTIVAEDIPYLGDNEPTSDEGGGESGEPVLAKIGNRIVAVGEKLVIVLSAEDPDGDSLKYSLYGTIPPDSTFDKELNTFTWIPLEAGLDLFITFIVTDGTYVDHETVEIKVVAEKMGHPPVLTRVSDRKVNVGQTIKIQIEATDPDGDVLQFGIAGDKPADATLNSSTGEFIWIIPAEVDQTVVRVTFQVSDGVFQDTMPVQFLVGDVGSPPEFTAVASQQVAFGTQARFVLEATDPDGDSVSLAVQSGMPNDAAFDPATGTFVWTPLEADTGRVIKVIFVASDGVFITYLEVEIVVVDPAPAIGCEDDIFEPNEDYPESVEIDDGTYELNICDSSEVPDDWDIFTITLEQGQTLDVTVTFDHLKGDIDIELIDSAQEEVLTSSTGVGNVEQFSYTATSDGNVYLLIYEIGDEGTASDYTLQVEIADTPPGCVDDDLEDNDDVGNATQLTVPQETLSGLMACPLDDDFFRIALQKHDSLTVTVTPSPGVLHAVLLGPDGETILDEENMLTSTATLTVTDVAEAATYYLHVTSYGQTPYTLGALVTPLQYKWIRIKDDATNQSLVYCYWNPGADIDAVELLRSGSGIGWATEVVATGLGTKCTKNTAADASKVTGPADETSFQDPNNLFVSLNGGEILVAFGDGAGGLQDIRSGDQVRVTEIVGDFSEFYTITLCNDSSCSVAVELGRNKGLATFDITY